MAAMRLLVLFIILSTQGRLSRSTELTFELPDRKTECFYEEIEKGTKSVIDFQVGICGHFFHTSIICSRSYLVVTMM